ncbi:MAG: methyltransferase domain-containing protein [Bacillota bacterium]
MVRWQSLNEDTRSIWDTNAANWDRFMGDEGNRFHLELIRPATERLLGICSGMRVLDVGCGNGLFSRRLARLGAEVLGIDFSAALVERARARSAEIEGVEYRVVDATDRRALADLGEFDAAVANMALMDMSELEPLIDALGCILSPGAPFVFSVSHPCFQTPGGRTIYEEEDLDGQIVGRSWVQITHYITPRTHPGSAIPGEPVPSRYFHRPLSALLGLFFRRGFVLDGLCEPTFAEGDDGRFEWVEIPPALICRVRRPGDPSHVPDATRSRGG